MVSRIALTGAARSGKDEVGKILMDLGYERRAFGDLIKWDVHHGTEEDFRDFYLWAAKNLPTARAWEVHCSLDFAIRTDANLFTEDSEEKQKLRPLLEEWGMWRYEKFLEELTRDLPPLVVNTRLMRVPEGRVWLDAGGVIWHVVRPGVEAATPFEAKCLDELYAARMISGVVRNDGTIERLKETVCSLVADV